MNRSQQQFDILIVGGGAVGSAIAYLLSRYELNVGVLEKEPDVAIGTSGRNSAVVHAGFNNRVLSLMAKLCVEGNRGFEEAAKTLNVPYQKTGKLVVGYTDEDREILKQLIETGEQNGCEGLRLIGEDEIHALEPNVPAKWAMLSPNTAIINPFLYNIHLAEAAAQNGVVYLLNHEVTAIERVTGGFTVSAGTESFGCTLLINAAGLFADRVSAMAGDDRYTIYPCRGEYYLLDKIPTDLLHMPVYPVPRPGVGGLGVSPHPHHRRQPHPRPVGGICRAARRTRHHRPHAQNARRGSKAASCLNSTCASSPAHTRAFAPNSYPKARQTTATL